MAEVWLYEESWGEWDETDSQIVGVFTTEEKAQAVAATRPDEWGDGTRIHKSITSVTLDTERDS